MVNVLISLLKICLISYVLACALLYFLQRHLLYFPTPEIEHPFGEIQIQNEGETISVTVLNDGHNDALLYFGGNGEAVIHNAERFTVEFPDLTIYLFNYRGYGGSSGSPSETANYADAMALYDTIKSNHTQVSVAGRSLGSGVATYLAANQPIHKLVLITPYDSVENVAKNNFRIFPVRLLLKDKYNSALRATKINSDVLVIAAENDEIIPEANTRALINAFSRDHVTE